MWWVVAQKSQRPRPLECRDVGVKGQSTSGSRSDIRSKVGQGPMIQAIQRDGLAHNPAQNWPIAEWSHRILHHDFFGVGQTAVPDAVVEQV